MGLRLIERLYNILGNYLSCTQHLKISNLNWFEKTESLALRITVSNNEAFQIICVYRDPQNNMCV